MCQIPWNLQIQSDTRANCLEGHAQTITLWKVHWISSDCIILLHVHTNIIAREIVFIWEIGFIQVFILHPRSHLYYVFAILISPPPVKPEGTIGLHSVCQSVRQSVCLSVCLSVRHTSFRTITDYVIHLWSWNFIHLLPMSQGCALLILGSKGQRSRSWRMVIWKWFPDDNWLCNQPMIMKLHTLAPHESRMCPIDFGVKRSRSWCMVIWKWFPDDNWLCNQPMIMKLHTLTHHESRMRPIDFEVKRSKVKVMAHGYLKMVSGR